MWKIFSNFVAFSEYPNFKLRDLEEIKQKLEIDLQDKTEALRIDIDQLELTERSTGLSHKPDPLKVIFCFLLVWFGLICFVLICFLTEAL